MLSGPSPAMDGDHRGHWWYQVSTTRILRAYLPEQVISRASGVRPVGASRNGPLMRHSASFKNPSLGLLPPPRRRDGVAVLAGRSQFALGSGGRGPPSQWSSRSSSASFSHHPCSNGTSWRRRCRTCPALRFLHRDMKPPRLLSASLLPAVDQPHSSFRSHRIRASPLWLTTHAVRFTTLSVQTWRPRGRTSLFGRPYLPFLPPQGCSSCTTGPQTKHQQTIVRPTSLTATARNGHRS